MSAPCANLSALRDREGLVRRHLGVEPKDGRWTRGIGKGSFATRSASTDCSSCSVTSKGYPLRSWLASPCPCRRWMASPVCRVSTGASRLPEISYRDVVQNRSPSSTATSRARKDRKSTPQHSPPYSE